MIGHYNPLRNLLPVIKGFNAGRGDNSSAYIGDILVNIRLLSPLRSRSGVQIFPKLKGIIDIDQSITLL